MGGSKEVVDAIFGISCTVDEPAEHILLESGDVMIVAVEFFLTGREYQARYFRNAHCLRFVCCP
jgi:hypothetical protein